MEENQNPNPAETANDEVAAPAEEPQTENEHWRVIRSDGQTAELVDPAGWWTASVDDNDNVRLTKLANVNLHNRPAGMRDSADATLFCQAEELKDRFGSLPWLNGGELVWPGSAWAGPSVEEADPGVARIAKTTLDGLYVQVDTDGALIRSVAEALGAKEGDDLVAASTAVKHELDFIREILGCEEGDDAVAKIQELQKASGKFEGTDAAIDQALQSAEANPPATPVLNDVPVTDPKATEIVPYSIAGLTADQNASLNAAFPTLEEVKAASDEAIDEVKGFGLPTVKIVRDAIAATEKPSDGA